MNWLSFLFLLDGIDRTRKYLWEDGFYFRSIFYGVILFLIGYPIMFIWGAIHRLKGIKK